jgi:hypothetical protein
LIAALMQQDHGFIYGLSGHGFGDIDGHVRERINMEPNVEPNMQPNIQPSVDANQGSGQKP